MNPQAEKALMRMGKIISFQSLRRAPACPDMRVVPTPVDASGIAVFAAQCERAVSAFGLTDRETQVFFLLARGRSVPSIAHALCISCNTAKTHVNHVYERMGVNGRQEMIDAIETL